MAGFLELLTWQDEFPFWYCGVRYEIVYENDGTLLLFRGDPPGILVAKYANGEDFLKNGSLDGKPMAEVTKIAKPAE